MASAGALGRDEPAGVAPSTRPKRAVTYREAHPILDLVVRRTGIGIFTLFLVSVVVFWATEILPGNAASAILGRNATPAHLRPWRLSFT